MPQNSIVKHLRHPLKQLSVIAIISTILAIAVTLALQVTTFRQQIAQLPPSISNPNQEPTPDTSESNSTTATWQTYTNQDSLVEFEYPSNFTIAPPPSQNLHIKPDTLVVSHNNITNYHDITPCPPTHDYFPCIDSTHTAGASLVNFTKRNLTDWIIFDVRIDDNTLVRHAQPYSQPPVIEIQINTSNKEQTLLLDQILSTFRFLGQEPTNTSSPVTGSITSYRVNIVNDQLEAIFKLEAQSTAGEVTQMLIWTDNQNPENPTWQPFTSFITLPADNLDYVYVQFKDQQGNTSTPYFDSIHPHQPGNLAL